MAARSTVNLDGLEVPLHDFAQLLNHLVLPPRLPQSADKRPDLLEHNLWRLISANLSSMSDAPSSTWHPIATMIDKLGQVSGANQVDVVKLESQLAELSPGSTCCSHSFI
jgi:hypothetical protein